MNKNVLSMIDVLIVMRITSPQDRKAIQGWVDVHGEDDIWNKMNADMPRLPIGTAYFWSPGWMDIFKKIKIRKRRTFDSSNTPQVGVTRVEPKRVADIDKEALAQSIDASIDAIEADDPVLLHDEIDRLTGQIKDLEKELKERPTQGEAEVEVRTELLKVFPEHIKNDILEFLEAISQESLKTMDWARELSTHVERDFDRDVRVRPMKATSGQKRRKSKGDKANPFR